MRDRSLGLGKSTLLAASTCSSSPRAEGSSWATRRSPRSGRRWTRCAAGGDGLPVVQPLPAQDGARERGDGPGEACSGSARQPRASAGATCWPGWGSPTRPASNPRPVRRPAAARRDRPGAGHGARGDALRRGHQRPRPGAGEGRARGDARAGRRRHDDDRGHPRDGLRPRGGRPRALHGRGRRSWSRANPTRCSPRPGRSAPGASSPGSSPRARVPAGGLRSRPGTRAPGAGPGAGRATP